MRIIIMLCMHADLMGIIIIMMIIKMIMTKMGRLRYDNNQYNNIIIL